jgi:hypothetical protein
MREMKEDIRRMDSCACLIASIIFSLFVVWAAVMIYALIQNLVR